MNVTNRGARPYTLAKAPSVLGTGRQATPSCFWLRRFLGSDEETSHCQTHDDVERHDPAGAFGAILRGPSRLPDRLTVEACAPLRRVSKRVPRVNERLQWV